MQWFIPNFTGNKRVNIGGEDVRFIPLWRAVVGAEAAAAADVTPTTTVLEVFFSSRAEHQLENKDDEVQFDWDILALFDVCFKKRSINKDFACAMRKFNYKHSSVYYCQLAPIKIQVGIPLNKKSVYIPRCSMSHQHCFFRKWHSLKKHRRKTCKITFSPYLGQALVFFSSAKHTYQKLVTKSWY